MEETDSLSETPCPQTGDDRLIMESDPIMNCDSADPKMQSAEDAEIAGIGHTKSAESIDERRNENIAYEYLCHLEEARAWIQACIGEELPATMHLEENLRNGVYLAKVANFANPSVIPLKKIYDVDQEIYRSKGLQFRHTDNINHWLNAMSSLGFPSHIFPDTCDVYDKKNMPKAIYCLHAFSMFLYKLGRAPQLIDLYGKVHFSGKDIDVMSKELQKYGVQMPAFHQIQGMFGNEISEISHHAAIVAINAAIGHKSSSDVFSALQNPSAKLKNVFDEYAERYHQELCNLKELKMQIHQEKTNNNCNVYNELLTWKDIQDLIDEVNTSECLNMLSAALLENDTKKFLLMLQTLGLDIPHTEQEYLILYIKYLRDYLSTCESEIFNSKQELQLAINEADSAISAAMSSINQALSLDNADETLEALKADVLNLHPVYDFAAYLYHSEFSCVRNENNKDLRLEEVKGGLQLLSSVALINKAVSEGDVNKTYEALCSPTAYIEGIELSNKTTYWKGLSNELSNKKQANVMSLLTHSEIQEVVDTVNKIMDDMFHKEKAIASINQSVKSRNVTELVKNLLDPNASIMCVEAKHAEIYLYFLEGQQRLYEGAELGLNEIQQAVNCGNKTGFAAYEKCAGVATINMFVAVNEPSKLIKALMKEELELEVDQSLGKAYLESLQRALENKKELLHHLVDEDKSSWIYYEAVEGIFYYFNLKSLEWHWADHKKHLAQKYLSLKEISDIVNEVNESARQDQRQKQKLKAHEDAAVVLQAHVRRWLAQKKYEEMRRQHWAAKKIQSWWRMLQTQLCFKALEAAETPTLSVVRRLLLNMQNAERDYAEEQHLKELKSQVVQMIRHNQKLEQEVKDMDVKIGLLVRNRITLQELISQKQRGKSAQSQPYESWIGSGGGLKALSKESQQLLRAYEHLFYALQTEPTYLARLVFGMPLSNSCRFMESVIFTLYNYGSTSWEEYQLIRLFRTALEQEVREKITDFEGVSTGNPTVIKMVVTFSRNCDGVRCLRELLETCVQHVIEDKTLRIIINPIDVYKLWINDMELSSGEPSGYSYDVTQEEALQHAEVRRRLDASIQKLKTQVEFFCNSIVNSLDKIPYGILYIAKVLKNALAAKFPQVPEKDLLKAVGNLLYYRYINPVIVAPDAFDIVRVGSKASLTNEQRRNLGCIAKVLQFAAAGKGFSNDNMYLESLNPFIGKCYEKFKEFFRQACCVPEPEEYYNVDSYTEATLSSQPVIQLSIQELCDTHRLLYTHRYDIAPDPKELIHELLDDLGEPPTLEKLVGENAEASSLRQIAKTTISLTLRSKYGITGSLSSDADDLFQRAKDMVTKLVLVRNPSIRSVQDMLKTPAWKEEDARFLDLLKDIRNRHLCKKTMNLNGFITELHQNLIKLELAGKVTKDNDYADILSSIIKDINYIRNHRQSRKRELEKLLNAQHQLALKTIDFEEKLEYYQQYVKRCLDNLSANTPIAVKAKSRKEVKKKTKITVLKYTAAKLQDKGILVRVRDVDPSQLKHITFEIASTAETGIFTVSAKFLEMDVEKVSIDIQNLLQLQYDGVAIMNIFDKATININLLLYLLNSKFYK